jgi:DNA-binding response OmpR family regulator
MEQDLKPTVLLVEEDYSLRRLIALGLRHRGMKVIEADAAEALSRSDAQTPSVLVLDVDRGIQCDWSLLTSAQSSPDLIALPVVVLTWDNSVTAGEPAPPIATATSSQVICVEKPFDARVLHEKIDALLAAKACADAAKEAEREALLLASYSQRPVSSIWPMVTAAGLLIAVIGLMFQFAIAAVGMIIVAVALLLWTLGTGSETRQIAPVA